MSAAVPLLAIALALLLWPAPSLVQAHRPGTAALWSRARSAIGDARVGWRVCLSVALGVTLVLGATAPPHAAICGGLVTAVAVTALARSRDRKRALAQESRDADSLHALAAELRAGHDLAAALLATATGGFGSLGTAMERAAHAIAMGERPADALERASAESLSRQLAGLVRISGSHGLPLADAVEVLAAEAEERMRHRRDLAGLLAGPRATASLLAALPVLGLVMGESIGAHPVRILLHTGAGAVAMTAGVALTVAGMLWTQSLVARAER